MSAHINGTPGKNPPKTLYSFGVLPIDGETFYPRDKVLPDLRDAVLDIFFDEKVQLACKASPLCIVKTSAENCLYLGYDKNVFTPLLYFFVGSETDQFPTSKHFALSANTLAFDEDVSLLRDEFAIDSAGKLKEMVFAAIAPQMTEKVQETQRLLNGAIQ